MDVGSRCTAITKLLTAGLLSVGLLTACATEGVVPQTADKPAAQKKKTAKVGTKAAKKAKAKTKTTVKVKPKTVKKPAQKIAAVNVSKLSCADLKSKRLGLEKQGIAKKLQSVSGGYQPSDAEEVKLRTYVAVMDRYNSTCK